MPSAVILVVSWSTPAEDLGMVVMLSCLRLVVVVVVVNDNKSNS